MRIMIDSMEWNEGLPTGVPPAVVPSWTLPRPKNMPLACFLNGLSSPILPKKRMPIGHPLFWCERWDSNPHGVTTRTSNVLVYHSNTLASAYVL